MLTLVKNKSLLLAVMLTVTLTGCGGGGGGGGDGPSGSSSSSSSSGGAGPDTDGDGVADSADTAAQNPCIPDNSNSACTGDKVEVDNYFSTLPVWEDFAYANQEKLDPANEGVETVDPESITIEEVLDGDNLTKVCTTERVSFYDAPEEYVMFATPGIFYPGALIQGKSLRDGAGPSDILPLNIAQRDTVVVSIPACSFAENFEETAPTQAGVSSAIGAIINRAELAGVNCIEARGSLSVETYSSDKQTALKGGIAGRYFGFSGSASGSYSKSKTENSIAVIFKETLFTARIQAPQTPNQWFSDEFTPELLQEQVDLGRIGVDNVPAYVSEVTYGRMMMFTMTSEASRSAMETHINFKYENPVGGISGNLSTKDETAIASARYTAAYLGEGSGYTWLSTLDWTSYFGDENEVTATDAVPISFTINSTRDDLPAVVQELAEYDRTTCVDKVAGGGTFEFGAKQDLDVSFSAGAAKHVVIGDLNGDKNDDIIWAAMDPAAIGEFYVAFSNGDGTFTTSSGAQPNIVENLGLYDVLAGDVDGDGRDDLVFNTRGSAGNRYSVAFYKPVTDGDDGFVYSAEHTVGAGGWSPYDVKLVQFDGARGLDIAWNNALNTPEQNRSYVNIAVDMSAEGFDLTTEPLFVRTAPLDHPVTGWSAYEYWHAGDFNGDGRDDFAWQNIGSGGNGIYLGLSTGTGLTFSNGGNYYFTQRGSNWTAYTSVFVGDTDGDGRADLLEPRESIHWDAFGAYTEYGSISAPYINPVNNLTGVVKNYQPDAEIAGLFPETVSGGTPSPIPFPKMYSADVDGNGLIDLIITQKSGPKNELGVGLANGNDSNYLDFSRKVQSHPDTSQGEWGQLDIYFGNIDGDDGNRREDILWIGTGEPAIVYTGRSRPAQ